MTLPARQFKTLVFLVLFFLFSSSASAGVGTVCDGYSWKPLRDYFGNALPGDPSVTCNGPQQPSQVIVQGNRIQLYARGTGRPQLATFGAVKAECDKLIPGHVTCHTTDPAETDLVESFTCGFPSTPALVLACDKNHCVSEIYGSACAGTYPQINPSPGYSIPRTPIDGFSVVGAIYDNADYSWQGFSTNADFTTVPHQAETILASGRMPILGLTWLLFNSADGSFRADAETSLRQLVNQHPTVFAVPGLPIEIYDEPFLGVDPSTIPARSEAIKQAIALVRGILPKASLGVAVAPVWNTDSAMIPAMEGILPGLQWLATDVYAHSLDSGTMNGALYLARQFAGYMRQFHPEIPIHLIIQGFAPVNSPPPVTWNQAQVDLFTGFISEMGGIAASLYNGAMIWGWSNVYELPPEYAGKNFPDSIKQFYLNKTRGL